MSTPSCNEMLKRVMRGSVIGAAALLFGLAPAGADEEKRPDYFPRGAETCFGRSYDAAHLKAHPQQTVTSFHIWHELTPDPLREFEDETADAKRAFDRNPNNRLGKLLAAKAKDDEILSDLYYAALGRAPVDDEKGIALDHVAKREDKRKAWEDVVWALINTREFLFRH